MQEIYSWNEIDFDQHIFFNLSHEINELIEPLREHFGLDSFNYHKTYNDNSQIRLTNTPDWQRCYLFNKLYQQSIFELPAYNYSKNRIIWSNIGTHSMILMAAAKFGITHGITLIEPSEDGCEFYFLGTTTNRRDVINKYLSNFQLLEKFISSFHQRGRKLFEQVAPFRVRVNDWLCNNLKFDSVDYIDKFKFLASISGYVFTNRELECLPLLLKGLSSKQIAEQLQISFRTVEDHINHLKIKTNSKSKNELLLVLSDKFS